MAAKQIQHKAGLVAAYIQRHAKTPLLVSMQGPQGSGKSSISAAVVDILQAQNLRCAVASMDDFYLPHEGLRAVAAASPRNALLSGRGPPGTHDLPLLERTLSSLRKGQSVDLPVFDKSLHGGEGDRACSTRLDETDVFLLEGWSLGFSALSEEQVEQRWAKGRRASQHPLESLLEINRNLAATQAALGEFDAHIELRPLSYETVYDWRLEAEHRMKERNGGRGMSDSQVRAFVDRYMPVYEVFEPQKRQMLRITLDERREVLDVAELT